MRYSPKPIEDYIEVSEHLSSIRGIAEQDVCSAEMWNLYWLSEPQLDDLLDRSKPWWESYQVNEALLVAITQDVLEDYHLAQALSWSPSRFLDWFCREDPTIYDCYDVFGPDWVETVKRRAMEAAARVEKDSSNTGNLIKILPTQTPRPESFSDVSPFLIRGKKALPINYEIFEVELIGVINTFSNWGNRQAEGAALRAFRNAMFRTRLGQTVKTNEFGKAHHLAHLQSERSAGTCTPKFYAGEERFIPHITDIVCHPEFVKRLQVAFEEHSYWGTRKPKPRRELYSFLLQIAEKLANKSLGRTNADHHLPEPEMEDWKKLISIYQELKGKKQPASIR